MQKTGTRSYPHRPSLNVAALMLAAPLMLAACEFGVGEDEALDDSASASSSSSSSAASSLTANFANPAGTHATVSTTGSINQSNAFFQSLGTNGRSCATCHEAGAAWSITPGSVQQRFNATNGTDPIFRLNDGANAPNLPVATLAQRQSAYSMVRTRGLIRVGLPIPVNAEFELTFVEDPYRFASAAELSLFRRPLPTANLKFLSGVMWDGRESIAGSTMFQNLARQANDANRGHAQATVDLTSAQQTSIVNFQLSLFTAQNTDTVAGSLTASGARGGPSILSQQIFFIGINDPLGGNPTGAPFTSKAFDIFDAFANQTGSAAAARRASIKRGQDIFNNHPIRIAGVGGLNDALGVQTVNGTCTTCHDSPNAGNHSVSLPLDIGLTTPAMRTGDMPLYTLRNKATGATVRTTDPGRAMITGKWADMNKFKGPILRGLAARAPYFHNGVAATLTDVVKFYDTQFHIGLDATKFVDLAAFLATL